MTKVEFESLSAELRQLAPKIPLNWGHIQNNNYDGRINMFDIYSYGELEDALKPCDDTTKYYFRRRWYLWQCSRCDEYLFSINPNVEVNPNPRDQSYDIEFNENLRFDIKGTIIPKSMRGSIDEVLANPQLMVDFFYEQQSSGVRKAFQNRLFLVHLSFVDQSREFYLRCAWGSKKEIFAEYSQKVGGKTNFLNYKSSTSDVIFILEREQTKVEHIIF